MITYQQLKTEMDELNNHAILLRGRREHKWQKRTDRKKFVKTYSKQDESGKDLIEKAKKRYAFLREIMDALEDIEDLDAEQIDKIYESMEEMGIEVLNDSEDVSEEATQEEGPLKK